MARRAHPKIEPRRKGYVIVYRGRILCRAPDRKSCEHWMEGWLQSAAEHEAKATETAQ